MSPQCAIECDCPDCCSNKQDNNREPTHGLVVLEPHEEWECAQAAQAGEDKANGSDYGFLSEFVGVKAEADDDRINASEEGVDRDGDQIPTLPKRNTGG